MHTIRILVPFNDICTESFQENCTQSAKASFLGLFLEKRPTNKKDIFECDSKTREPKNEKKLVTKIKDIKKIRFHFS